MLATLAAPFAHAQTPAAAAEAPDQIVVTGSVAGSRVADAPFAVGLLDREALRNAGPLVNLSEAMARVPGLSLANRWNFAQDLQISSRGFGARAGFGVRGLRLYTDGIPASGPDGQGQVSHFDLAGAERVEVLRGPFSVLYGNSSGGVISLVSATPRAASAEASLDLGSFGARQLRVQGQSLLGDRGSLRLAASSFEVDGFRPHSEGERDLFSARLGWKSGAHDWVVQASALNQPAQDPLGLTRAQFDQNPLQTAPEAAQYDTRKTTRQQQLGARWLWRADLGAWRELQLATYLGDRAVQQFLAIAPGTQRASARHAGAVVDFARVYAGYELRARWAWDGLDLAAGIASDAQREQRRGFENFLGSSANPSALGVIGALRRDEIDRARSSDAYLQAEWQLRPDWQASAGLRSGRVTLSARDFFLSNGDDSGSRSFAYTNPVLGLRWRPAAGWNLHASAARGYESPTLGEVAYRRDGSAGLNTELLPQRSRQLELGAKWRGAGLELDLAAFDVQVRDEIGVATNAGGRSSFQNVGRTSRRGLELTARWQASPSLSLAASATSLRARYLDNFLVCAGIPCTAPTLPVPAGNRIAGTQRGSGFLEASWRSAWGQFAAEVRSADGMVVNDRNSDSTAAYTLLALRWSQGVSLGAGWRGEWLLRLDNLADRRYAGSAIVNESNGRYFETGAPRQVQLSLRVLTP